MRRAFLLAIALAGVLAAPAHASTLVNANGTLTYTGTGTAAGDISLSGGGPVLVTRNAGDADPFDSAPTGCTPVTPDVSYNCGGAARVVIVAGGGDDQVDATGLMIPAALGGGDGDDTLTGGSGNDTADGGAGSDSISGGLGDDVLGGGDGNDDVSGDDGADVVNGDAGDDFGLSGGAGNDTVNGGDGDDFLTGGAGTDVLSGGAGIDGVSLTSTSSIAVTLDGLPNDGAPGENDNVLTDVEDVAVDATTTANLTGDADGNILSVSGGKATIVGGDGTDFITGGPLDDTIDARDGYPDRVYCGAGTDTALVDPLDTVSQSCENAPVTVVPGGADDKPPAITWNVPGANARFRGDQVATLVATATDDRGVAKVRFYDGSRLICEDTAAPYSCRYQARGSEVGRNALIATAIDGDNQATSAVRMITVTRFRPTLTLTASRKGHGYKAKGTLSRAGSCSGTVTVTGKVGKRTISSRRTKLSKGCRYSTTVRFKRRPAAKVKVTARYGGNRTTLPRSSKGKNVKLK
jgi:Ca2+-binding RTX toxin-like protein